MIKDINNLIPGELYYVNYIGTHYETESFYHYPYHDNDVIYTNQSVMFISAIPDEEEPIFTAGLFYKVLYKGRLCIIEHTAQYTWKLCKE